MSVPIKFGIAKKVDDGILNRVEKKSRDYLGASILGEECSKKIWYMFHKPKVVESPRLQRIFDLGHILEDYMIKLLKDAGLTVWEKDQDGNQFGFRDGLIAGHCDGVAIGLPESTKPHLLEFKTSNSNRFSQFVKNGCEATEIKYWVQMHIYMYKLGLEKALLMIINKDNQELYFERVTLDKEVARRYLSRGNEIANAQLPPARRYSKPTFYKCKFCDYQKECWDGVENE